MGHRNNITTTVCVSNMEGDDRLYSPSALRNAEPIVELVRNTAIKSGNALEIASGTGQHVVKLAAALPFRCPEGGGFLKLYACVVKKDLVLKTRTREFCLARVSFCSF